MSVFTKIISGEIPCYKVAEDENNFAFLDIRPNTKGHTLCVPKTEVDKIFDLNQSEYLDLMAFAHKVAKAIEKTVPCNRVGMAVVGLEVPHAHVHLIPLNEADDIDFKKELKLTAEEFTKLAEEIKGNLR